MCQIGFPQRSDTSGHMMKTTLAFATTTGLFAILVSAIAACTSPGAIVEDPMGTESDFTADAGDAGPHCHVARLHSTDGTKGPYCPFQASGAPTDCASRQHCCEPTHGGSTCSATACTFAGVADAGAGGSDFECDSKMECPSGQVCCLLGEVKPTTASGCTELVGVGVRGTACRTSCAASEPAVCAQQADCSQGTCTPFATKGKDLGFCK
jgi:hypothetical protein